MKRAFLIIVFLISLHSVYSQKSSINVDFGYRFNVERIDKWGLGFDYQYLVLEKVRIAPSVMAYFNDKVISLDIHANLHYLIPINNRITLYPLVGLAMANNYFDAIPNNISTTDWGGNLGAGVDYNFSKKRYIQLQFSYTFLSKEKHSWSEDYPLIKIGYGFRF